MKKLLASALILIMCSSLAACSNSSSTQQSSLNGNQPQLNITAKKVLVAYFSREGNTLNKGGADAVSGASLPSGCASAIANQIHQEIGGDIFEIVTEEPYSPNYYNLINDAKKEQNDNSRPKLATKVENMSSYDVIFLGYPDWWGTMPMAVFSFLEQYDFSGKTIIPFCTHEGSGLGQSVTDIKKLCPKSTVLDGISVRANDAKNAQDDVNQWLSTLGIKKNN